MAVAREAGRVVGICVMVWGIGVVRGLADDGESVCELVAKDASIEVTMD